MSETALLEAVRDKLIEKCGYDESQCDVELDEDAVPATVGDLYILVHPVAWKAGPNNNSSGGVLDELFDVAVTVIKRSTAVPSDRRRNVLLDNFEGLNVHLRKIIAAVGQFSYEVNNYANALLGSTAEGFVEPLRFAGASLPRAVGAEAFRAMPGKQPAGLKRTALFANARRVQTLGAATS